MNPLRPLTRPLRRAQRRVLLHRRPLAALAAAGTVLAALQSTSPPPPDTVEVWTVDRDLPGGAVLARDDLSSTRLPPEAVPDHAVAGPGDVVGHTLAAPMSRGEALTSVRLVATGLLRGYPGRTAVPLRVTDAGVVDLLRVGDHAGFVVADPDGRTAPRMLLEDAPVVAIPARRGGFSTGSPGRLVVVAVPRSSASAVAAAAATSVLIPVWSR